MKWICRICEIKNEEVGKMRLKKDKDVKIKRWILEYQIKTSIDLKVFVMRQKS